MAYSIEIVIGLFALIGGLAGALLALNNWRLKRGRRRRSHSSSLTSSLAAGTITGLLFGALLGTIAAFFLSLNDSQPLSPF